MAAERDIDVWRGLMAAGYLHDAALNLRRAATFRGGGRQRAALTTAAAHLRQARGYLGAIGFEKGERL